MKFRTIICLVFYLATAALSLEIRKNHKTSEGQKRFEDAEFWKENAQEALAKKLESNIIMETQAKNIIFYLGDGMSATTISAARILKGQKVDNLPYGEEGQLYMETFPYTAVSKTFCSNTQIPDSACTATAYLCGTKANIGTMGVTPAVMRGDCAGQADSNNHVSSVLAWAQAAGKSTGVVSRSKVTDASPGGTYAHIADRDWENDNKVREAGWDPDVCVDIAKQLISGDTGSQINVILGGGRLQFLPNTTADPENPNEMGYRGDNLNLIETWLNSKNESKAAYLTGRDELLQVNTADVDYLLGLFSTDDMAYMNEQDEDNDPSLEEMTRVAIEILGKNPNGFFLFVEGSNIDSAHHKNLAQRALWETIELDRAVKLGDEMTADNETLIVVTADHSHVMTFTGDAVRGSPILEIAELGADGLPYGILGYANGPSPGFWDYETGKRRNISGDDFNSMDYQQPSPVPRGSESHGGDDVLIISKGPYAHLLSGYQMQSYIPHAIGYAACIGSGAQHCQRKPKATVF